MAAPHLHLILSLEICPDRINVTLVNSQDRLAVINSTTIPLRCVNMQEPRRDAIHDSSAAYDPSQPRKAISGSHATPFAVRNHLKALDEALEWLSKLSSTSLPGSCVEASPSPASSIVAISIASAPDLRVLTSTPASSILHNLSPDKPLHIQLDHSDFLAHPLLLHNFVTPQLGDLVHLENRLAERIGLHIIDCGSERIRRDPDMPVERLVSRESFRNTLTRRLGGPLAVDSLPVQLAAALSSAGSGATQTGRGQLDAAVALAHTERIVDLGTLFACVLTGKIIRPSAIEASMTGFLNVNTQQWDEELIAVVANSSNTRQQVFSADGLKAALGTARQGTASIGRASPWLTKRFHFDPSCVVMSPIPSYLASYFSHLPQYGDIGLELGNDDYLIVPTTTPVFIPGARIVPHPLASQSSSNAHHVSSSFQPPTHTHLVVTKATGAGRARKTIRDVYTNANWDAYQKLMSAVCAGGSIGMDNKFYSVCKNFETRRDLNRYEMGIRVEEFSDLRANARCLIEGQALSVRSSIGRIWTGDRESTSFFDEARQFALEPVPSNVDFASGYHGVGGALRFDPYDVTLCPVRVLAWGKAAHNRGMAECYANILGGTWTTEQEAQENRRHARASHTSSRVSHSRAALGAAYLAFAALEAQSAEQKSDTFAGFHTALLDKLSGRDTLVTPPPSDTMTDALSRKASHSVDTSGKMTFATPSSVSTNPSKLPVGGRARSSSSPITAFGGSSTSSRASTLSSGSSSPFAMDTVSLILSPSSSSYISSPLNTGLRSANAWAAAATSHDLAGKHQMVAGSRPRTSSNLPAPLHPTLLTVLDEGEEDMTTPRNIQDLSTQQTPTDVRETLVVDELDRPISVLGRMTSAPNFSSSLAMTNAFQPVGTAVAGRSRASSSSASSWGDAPRRDGADGTGSASIGPKVQWSSSVAPSRSNSFSSAFSPDAKPFVSEATVSQMAGSNSRTLMSGRPRSTTLHTIGTTSRWPWTQMNPAANATSMLRSSSSSLSTSDVRQRSGSGSSYVVAHDYEAGQLRGMGGAPIQEGIEEDLALRMMMGNNKAEGNAQERSKGSRETPTESKQEKAMRAWLQGQSLSPPILSDTAHTTSQSSAQHIQDGAAYTQPMQLHGQIQTNKHSTELGRAALGVTSSGPLDDLSLAYFDPLCKNDTDVQASSQLQSKSQPQSHLHHQQETQRRRHHLWATHQRELDAQRRESERLLDLQRGPMADLDVWAVYGAFLEEYVRLRGE